MLKFFRIPFATSGDRAPVPDPADVNGLVSYEQGYGFDYQRQKTDPASKNIERDKMNEIFFDMTTAVAELQAAGVPDFITSVLNGGTAYSYAEGALVRYKVGSTTRVYQSRVDVNVALPTDATKWSLLPVQAISAPIASAATLVLTGVVGDYVHITGSTGPVTAIALREGSAVTLVFDSTPTLIHSSTLILPGAVNFKATADAALTFRGEAGGVVRCTASPSTTTAPAQIQGVSASVAANALTLGYAGGALSFRNATLTNGIPIAPLAVGALSLVVPSGATLGTVSGQSARLALVVAYNAGAPVLCATNLSGGLSLDETGVISPTTIGGASNSANVIYSASAVAANSPYRVVGFVDISETAAGTWATDATLKQGVGGQALAALSSLGYGQTWKDVSASRVNGVTYYNDTGRPICVKAWSVTAGASAGSVSLTVGGVLLPAVSITGSNATWVVDGIVPPGSTYVVTMADPRGGWVELR